MLKCHWPLTEYHLCFYEKKEIWTQTSTKTRHIWTIWRDREEVHLRLIGEIGIMLLKATNIYCYQKLGKGRKDPPVEVLKGAWSYQHLELGIPDFKLQRIYISLTKYSVYSTLLWQSYKIKPLYGTALSLWYSSFCAGFMSSYKRKQKLIAGRRYFFFFLFFTCVWGVESGTAIDKYEINCIYIGIMHITQNVEL